MVNTLEALAMVGREEWGKMLHTGWPASPNWMPVYHTPSFLVVHHTVTSNQWQPLAAVQAIWRYHALTQGWGDIRYHYLIGQDGVIYEGRWRGQQPVNIYVEGGQTMTSNTHKVGLTLLGQFEPSAANPPPAEPTPAALEALVKLLGAICFDLELDPLGKALHPLEGKTYPIISGHRDHYRTLCPGRNLYNLLPDIRQQVAAEIQRLQEQEPPEPEPPPIPSPPATSQIALEPREAQVAWGKSVWPNLLWGDDDLYVGAWGDAVYYSLIEFTLPEKIRGGVITGLELSLTGQDDVYLRETEGTFQAVLLEAPLRGGTTTTVPFEQLRQATAIANFLPPLSAGNLKPGTENKLSVDPAGLDKVNLAAAGGVLAIRLEGPSSGRRLFAWDSGYGEGGLLKKPVLTLQYQ
ncbi:MAG: N-acetylmuramoyl-L-alanine amidase [Anaerolineae bacterium]|nr:N-acetylmuramoyl-L-alanine amidase [Anaerolineae bacterium]